MNITLIHGEDKSKSGQKLIELMDYYKNKGTSIERIDLRDKDINDVLSSVSLFPGERVFIIEDIKSISDGTLAWLKKNADNMESDMILYSDKELTKTQINSLPNIHKEYNHKIPKVIWSFIESFYPGNAKNCLQLFRKVVKNEPDQFVFEMLARQVRDLYWVKMDPKGYDGPSWKKGKLASQASKFTQEDLKIVIEKLADADVKSKTSNDKLPDLLDFIIITELE